MNRGYSDRHPGHFTVACCSGRRLILGGVLVCRLCDMGAFDQSEKGEMVIRVPINVETITLKPPTA